MQTKQSAVSTSDQTSDIAPQPPVEQKNGVISSIKDAMGLGKKMSCTYTNPADPSVSTTVFIDGQKIKTTTAVKGETLYGIFDGNTQYTWTAGATKQGFKMNKSCTDELKNLAPQTPAGNAPTPAPTPVQDSQSFDNAQNVNCVAADDTDFSIPSDITFTDQCEMLRNSVKSLNQIKQQLPAGAKLPAGVNVPPVQY